MSRSGYSEDFDDNWMLIIWRGAVASAINGKRGQAFLKDLLNAMDAMPEKKLIADELECEGAVCAIGALGRSRGLDMSKLDPEDIDTVAAAFGISGALAKETVWMNDDGGSYKETSEQRFERMRSWVASQIKEPS